MTPSNLHDPARMTPAQLRSEAAALLALGLHRLRCGHANRVVVATSAPNDSGLGFYTPQRVHVDSTNRSPQA